VGKKNVWERKKRGKRALEIGGKQNSHDLRKAPDIEEKKRIK